MSGGPTGRPPYRLACAAAGIVGGVLLALMAGEVDAASELGVVAGVLIAVGFAGLLVP